MDGILPSAHLGEPMRHSPMSDRRRTDRRALPATAKASFGTGIEIVNAGPRGIEIETAERLLIGADVELEVVSHGEAVPVRGTVVWSRLDRTAESGAGELRPVYRCGIEAASQSIPALEKLLESSRLLEA
jgi:hypothetical protein